MNYSILNIYQSVTYNNTCANNNLLIQHPSLLNHLHNSVFWLGSPHPLHLFMKLLIELLLRLGFKLVIPILHQNHIYHANCQIQTLLYSHILKGTRINLRQLFINLYNVCSKNFMLIHCCESLLPK